VASAEHGLTRTTQDVLARGRWGRYGLGPCRTACTCCTLRSSFTLSVTCDCSVLVYYRYCGTCYECLYWGVNQEYDVQWCRLFGGCCSREECWCYRWTRGAVRSVSQPRTEAVVRSSVLYASTYPAVTQHKGGSTLQHNGRLCP